MPQGRSGSPDGWVLWAGGRIPDPDAIVSVQQENQGYGLIIQ